MRVAPFCRAPRDETRVARAHDRLTAIVAEFLRDTVRARATARRDDEAACEEALRVEVQAATRSAVQRHRGRKGPMPRRLLPPVLVATMVPVAVTSAVLVAPAVV